MIYHIANEESQKKQKQQSQGTKNLEIQTTRNPELLDYSDMSLSAGGEAMSHKDSELEPVTQWAS